MLASPTSLEKGVLAGFSVVLWGCPLYVGQQESGAYLCL